MNPVDEFLLYKKAEGAEDALSAMGAVKGFGRRMGPAFATGAAIAAGTAGVAALSHAASKIYEAATKGRDFRSMLEANPDLAMKHEEDPKSFNQMFNALRAMNTEFSAEPLVAGSYMRSMIDSTPEMRGLKAVSARLERGADLGPIGQAAVKGFGQGVGLKPHEEKALAPQLQRRVTTEFGFEPGAEGEKPREVARGGREESFYYG